MIKLSIITNLIEKYNFKSSLREAKTSTTKKWFVKLFCSYTHFRYGIFFKKLKFAFILEKIEVARKFLVFLVICMKIPKFSLNIDRTQRSDVLQSAKSY